MGQSKSTSAKNFAKKHERYYQEAYYKVLIKTLWNVLCCEVTTVG